MGLIVLVGVVAYANSLSGPFVFDDRATVIDNASIRDWSLAAGVRRHPRDPDSWTAARQPLDMRSTTRLAAWIRAATTSSISPSSVVRDRAVRVHPQGARTAAGAGAPAAMVDRHRVRVGLDLDGSSAQHGSRRLHHAAQRVDDGVVLSGDALRRRPRHFVVAIEDVVGRGDRIVRARHDVQESMATAPATVWLFDAVFVFGSAGAALRKRWPLYAGARGHVAQPDGRRLVRSAHVFSRFATKVAPWTYLLNQTVMIARYLRLLSGLRELVVAYGPVPSVTLAAVWP